VVEDLHAQVNASLRRLGQRYTSGRRVLVTTLFRALRPLTTSELVAAEPGLLQSTTYKNLALLEQAGIVHRVIGSDEYARFELAEELTGHHHHHLVCVICGSIEDFEVPHRVEKALAEAVGDLTSGTGFRAESHRLDLLGTCAGCRQLDRGAAS
jgi:Fur family ferric uptake transcriptional regulator